jgi:hypothetical protein
LLLLLLLSPNENPVLPLLPAGVLATAGVEAPKLKEDAAGAAGAAGAAAPVLLSPKENPVLLLLAAGVLATAVVEAPNLKEDASGAAAAAVVAPNENPVLLLDAALAPVVPVSELPKPPKVVEDGAFTGPAEVLAGVLLVLLLLLLLVVVVGPPKLNPVDGSAVVSLALVASEVELAPNENPVLAGAVDSILFSVGFAAGAASAAGTTVASAFEPPKEKPVDAAAGATD